MESKDAENVQDVNEASLSTIICVCAKWRK